MTHPPAGPSTPPPPPGPKVPTLGMVPDRPRPVIPPPPPPPRPRVDTTRPFGVMAGRWGFDPAVQRVALGNLDPARRGRDKYLTGAR